MNNWLSKIFGGKKEEAQRAAEATVAQTGEASAPKEAGIGGLQTIAAAMPREAAAIVADEAKVAVEWQVGDVILDLYEVKQVHEGGGMGLVYRVHHRGNRRPKGRRV
jgi:hypothetical protein